MYWLVDVNKTNEGAIFLIKNPRNQGVSQFQSGEELVNSVGL